MRNTQCGRSLSGADAWDEVWDDYEARQQAAAPAASPVAARPPSAAQARHGRGLLPAATMGAAFLLGCLAGSVWPVLSLVTQVMRDDVPAVLGVLDAGPAHAVLRQQLRAHAGLPAGDGGDAAARMLAGMADAMADDLAAPGALRRMVAVRNGAIDPHTGGIRSPAAVALPRLAADGGMAVTLAPAQGGGGLRLQLAFNAGGWQARSVTLLDPPVRPDAARLALAGPGAGRRQPRA